MAEDEEREEERVGEGRMRGSEEDWEIGGRDRGGALTGVQEEGDDESGFLRDVGVVGILQQIMGR
jgi:hypothetical protein